MLDILQHGFVFERAVITPYTFATVLLPPIFSCYVMAVLVQLPHTILHRTSLLPIVYWLAFRAGMSLDLSWNNPSYDSYNFGLAVSVTFLYVQSWTDSDCAAQFIMFIISTRCTGWVFAQRTYTRLPPRELGTAAIKNHNGDIPVKHEVSLSLAMWNACDLLANQRGIGWIGPPKMPIPSPHFRVESRVTFFFLSLGRVVLLLVFNDILGRCVSSFGLDNALRMPEGGTLFDPSLPPLERYRNSSLITFAAAFSAYFAIDAGYHLLAVLFTLLFQQYPSQWPPFFDAPLLSTSLTSFWSTRWHQSYRESFVEVGSRPLEIYFGRVGRILGAFAVSAALHDVGLRGMG